MHYIQNHIVSKESFAIRCDLLDVRMFDELTNSNAESKHAALKSNNSGVLSSISMSGLVDKTMIMSQKRSNLKSIEHTRDIHSTITSSDCELSKIIVKNCFFKLQNLVNLGNDCISKQVNFNSWIVIYLRKKEYNYQIDKHYLPYIQRK